MNTSWNFDYFTDSIYKKCTSNIVIRYITSKTGYLNSFKAFNDKRRYDNLLFHKIFAKIGSKVSKPQNNHDRLGVIITQAKTRQQALNAAEKYYNYLNLSITRNKKENDK